MTVRLNVINVILQLFQYQLPPPCALLIIIFGKIYEASIYYSDICTVILNISFVFVYFLEAPLITYLVYFPGS